MPLLNFFSGLGLSSAAGLNAYIPLLMLSVLANRGFVQLTGPYEVISSWWAMGVLAVLCGVELVVDKVPGVDHVNDVIQTAIRPTAGAILFASQAGVVHAVHPLLWVVLGVVIAGAVHAAKALARPVVNFGTVGIGAPILSSLENLLATVVAVLAVLAPIVCVIFMVVFGVLLFRAFRRFVRFPRKHRVVAVAVEES